MLCIQNQEVEPREFGKWKKHIIGSLFVNTILLLHWAIPAPGVALEGRRCYGHSPRECLMWGRVTGSRVCICCPIFLQMLITSLCDEWSVLLLNTIRPWILIQQGVNKFTSSLLIYPLADTRAFRAWDVYSRQIAVRYFQLFLTSRLDIMT